MNDRDDNEQRCSRSGVNPSIVLTRAGDSRYYKMLPKAGNEIDINEPELGPPNGLYVSGVIYLSDYRWEIASQLPHCQPGWRGGETTFYRRNSVIIEPILLSLSSFSPSSVRWMGKWSRSNRSIIFARKLIILNRCDNENISLGNI